ncbi:hypothetical protein AX16_006857 [Volvariella volvacea WC 439]|nr:hypothetical protein AX16_006857 [Volvariella volvacea WC 439]
MSSTSSPPSRDTKPDDPDAERTQLDQEILVLENQLSRLRRRRNELAPISQLPTDVFQLIMLNVVPSTPCPPKSWIQFTQVSHHWRVLSLGSPLVWTKIDLSNMSSAYACEFIRRSGDAPLTIRVDCSVAPPAVKKSIHPGWNILLHSLDFSQSPALKSLEMWYCRDLYRDWNSTFKLRYLNLKQGCFNACLFSSHLIELALMNLDRDTMPSLSDFYRLLASLSNLRVLNLFGVLTRLKIESAGSMPVLATQPTIWLPHLRRLDLFDGLEQECARLLSHLSFPNLEKLFISINKGLPTTLQLLTGVLADVWGRTMVLNQIIMGIPAPDRCLQVYVDGASNALRVLDSIEGTRREMNISWASESAHRADSGRPLGRLLIECDEYGTLEGEAGQKELDGLGSVIEFKGY